MYLPPSIIQHKRLENIDDTAMKDLKIPSLDNASGQIRLLSCLGQEEASVELKVTVWNLDNLPEYHAISYTWGSPLDTATICIDGRPYTVRWNSYYALWQARRYVSAGYLWMDSICIDQASVEEKNQQVQMMGHIYASAQGVLACVGPHADGSEQLYQHRLIQEPRNYVLKDTAWMWKILKSFWHRPYWRRIWIVQELVLANSLTIHCGPDVLYFKDLSLLPWREDWADHLVSATSVGMTLAKGFHHRRGLWDTMIQYTIHQCTDLRDHVYGVLALYTPDSSMFRTPIKVDYSISLPLLVLEVIKRQRHVRNTFGRELVVLLEAMGLASGDGLSALNAFRQSIMRKASAHTKLDGRLLAACWYDFPMTQELPDVVQHLAMGCKIATFDADPKGSLTVRPWQMFKDLRPWIPSALGPKKFFAPSEHSVTQVSFDVSIKDAAYTLTVRTTSAARPRDLLLRTGQQIFGDPGNRSVSDLSPGSRVASIPSISLDYDRLKDRCAEEFVVVRWMGPSLWKVVGQAHVIACIPGHHDRTLAPESLCFNDDVRKFGLAYSLMSAEAKFMQWTHCLTIPYTDRDTRARMLDELVSRAPPPSYLYIVPVHTTELEDCRQNVEPEWRSRYCRDLTSPDPQEPKHLWFSDQARDFLGGQVYDMRSAEKVRKWEDMRGYSMPECEFPLGRGVSTC